MSFQVTEDVPTPLRRVMRAVDDAFGEITKRWRGIILAFVLFVAIWLAVQAVTAVYRGYAYLRDNAPGWPDFTREIPLPSAPAPSLPPLSNCWRDRSLATGSCFQEGGAPHHHIPLPAPRFRFRGLDCGCLDI